MWLVPLLISGPVSEEAFYKRRALHRCASWCITRRWEELEPVFRSRNSRWSLRLSAYSSPYKRSKEKSVNTNGARKRKRIWLRATGVTSVGQRQYSQISSQRASKNEETSLKNRRNEDLVARVRFCRVSELHRARGTERTRSRKRDGGSRQRGAEI